jgi:serine/threonine protein kinase
MKEYLQKDEPEKKIANNNTCNNGIGHHDDDTVTDYLFSPEEELNNSYSKNISKYAPEITLMDGRYHIIKELGAGGMGKVYLARDTKMESDIVIKQLLPFVAAPSTLKYLEERFKEEAKLLFKLNNRGFPKVIDYFFEGDCIYVVMQYIEGKNLNKILKEQGANKLPLVQSLTWLDKMLELLEVLHKHEPPIIHRDIKPSNIMIDKFNNIYLVDFGVARTVGDDTLTPVGTYGYASPEHLTGKYDITSDLFSLGATFHHLLTGEKPNEREIPFNYPLISKYVSNFPQEIQKIFDRLLALNKSSRYKNATEVRIELNEIRKKKPELFEENRDLQLNIQDSFQQEIIDSESLFNNQEYGKTNSIPVFSNDRRKQERRRGDRRSNERRKSDEGYSRDNSDTEIIIRKEMKSLHVSNVRLFKKGSESD